jgi:serine protease Do
VKGDLISPLVSLIQRTFLIPVIILYIMVVSSRIEHMDTGTSVNNKRSNGLKIALVIIVLISLVGFGSVGYLGWVYYKNIFKEAKTALTGDDTEVLTTKDFTSSVVYEPSGTIVDLVTKASPAVVTVVSKVQVQSLFADSGESEGIGTGFFISEDGLLITNEHVIGGANDVNKLSIVTSSNKTYEVTSMAKDPAQDIAILKVNVGSEKVPFLKFSNTDSPIKIGMDVIAIGNPLGVNPGSVTKGIVSGLNRNIRAGDASGSCVTAESCKDYEGVLQTDAAINGGNSGGPLLSLNGEVIGVNSATTIGANSISYSIPFQRVVKLVERYSKNGGKLTFPYLGVQYRMIDQNVAKANDIPAGAQVIRVLAGSPVAQAGILKGDIITKIGDHSMDFSLQATLNQYFEPNQKVKVEVYRPARTNVLGEEMVVDGKALTLDLTIGEK